MKKSLFSAPGPFPYEKKYEVDAGYQDGAGFVILNLAGQQKQDCCLKANLNLI